MADDFETITVDGEKFIDLLKASSALLTDTDPTDVPMHVRMAIGDLGMAIQALGESSPELQRYRAEQVGL